MMVFMILNAHLGLFCSVFMPWTSSSSSETISMSLYESVDNGIENGLIDRRDLPNFSVVDGFAAGIFVMKRKEESEKFSSPTHKRR